ncbi:MAG TPA: hypothetical protein VFM68_00555 [Candidatus Saccharimonadales bacterium]|nr:hypothetical protein [Candidatus Saccharimonadales bacterium]
MNLITLEAQNNFPHEDISDSNAEILEMLLQNQTIHESSHKSAEAASILYKMGHQTLLTASQIEPELSQSDALSHGISTYEAISALVHPNVDAEVHDSITIHPHLKMAYMALRYNFDDETERVYSYFGENLPRMRQIVETSAERFHKRPREYAIIGAALAHQIDINASR